MTVCALWSSTVAAKRPQLGKLRSHIQDSWYPFWTASLMGHRKTCMIVWDAANRNTYPCQNLSELNSMKDLLNSRPALTTVRNKHIQDPTVPDALPIGDPFERPCHMQRRSEANTKELTEVTGSLVFLPGTPTAMHSKWQSGRDDAQRGRARDDAPARMPLP